MPFNGLGHETPAIDHWALKALVEDVKPFVAVEVGSYVGSTALTIADAAPECALFCVDTFQGPRAHRGVLKAEKIFGTFCKNIGPRLFTTVFPLCGPSRVFAENWPEEQKADLIFLDADHAYDSVAQDIRLWWPHVIEGGVLAMHDYGAIPSVTQAIKDAFLPGGPLHGRDLQNIGRPVGGRDESGLLNKEFSLVVFVRK